ncbi:MAG: hypothetical protein EOM16_07015 [Bacteroidia bacterium]|nr:hypothetical protein [Bacteroidia bacterium]
MEIKFIYRYLITLTFLMVLTSACNQSPTDKKKTLSSQKYDQELAQKYGADEYGMKSYIFVILKTGPDTTSTKEQLNQLFRGHMDNIKNLSEQGKLVVAGPMTDKNEKNYRGIFILNTNDMEEAHKMLMQDPAIAKGVFEAELYPWYGSAALPAYMDVHEKIARNNP